MPNQLIDRADIVEILVRRGQDVLRTVDLDTYDRWKGEVQQILNRDVSPHEATKFSLIPDALMGRGIPEVYGGMVGTRIKFLEVLREQLMLGRSEAKMPSIVKVFISHSAADQDLADAVVVLLKDSLVVTEADIRCTSVDGHKLETGADAADTLRDELTGAPVVIGLLTSISVGSAWVLFELGARWGQRGIVKPLLHPDCSFDILPGPLKTKHAIKLNNEPALFQLIEEVSKQSGLPQRSLAVLPKAVQRFIQSLKALPKAEETIKNGPSTTPDISAVLKNSGMPPSDAAKLLFGMGPLPEVIRQVLQVQETLIRDLPTPRDKSLKIVGRAGDPYEHMHTTISLLCEDHFQVAEAPFKECIARIVALRIKKGEVFEWHYSLISRILELELRGVFGPNAGDIVEAGFDKGSAGQTIPPSALTQLLPRGL